ncbi:TPA: hypothetical protein RCG80_002914 [Enterobacter roggenkampii]|nr:hypothetical protein [Enterobacter roggenkampii]
MIIQLTDASNNPVFINSDKIVWFNVLNGQTVIRVEGEQFWNVQESPQYIIDEMNRASNH